MNVQHQIDVNCDLGEGVNLVDCKNDARLMTFISSCNIACGGHAGNAQTMQETVNNAISNHIKIGAHPSFPDRANFGRKRINLTDKELSETLTQQIVKLKTITDAKEKKIHHVKPHGALYNLAATDLKIAILIAEQVANISQDYTLVGLAQSEMANAAEKVGLKYLHEGFMDRRYEETSILVPRTHPLAVIDSIEDSIEQALKLATGKSIQTLQGSEIYLNVDTICLHGDTPQALSIATELSHAFKRNHIQLAH